jgi:hypothetical protein
MAQTKMALKSTVGINSRFVKGMCGFIDVIEFVIVRLLLFGIFLYGIVQIIRHL